MNRSYSFSFFSFPTSPYDSPNKMFHVCPCPITPLRLGLISSSNAAVSPHRRRRRQDHRNAAFGSAGSREGGHYSHFLFLANSQCIENEHIFHQMTWQSYKVGRPRVPRAVGLYFSCSAAQASKGNFKKAFNKTFFHNLTHQTV